ncbi:protein of unknown function (plasmid) [Magnetospirillum sp. XM-1]|uniref:hypothetical protein n=1 Tax=Magnetospirillum sp. XM-1 TaxID=1663591 RepID=UPI00073DE864|nr:hypothetical protein [Magnetospirillum sp. XM-1]CUW41912.1 protein of unknown function [Magnetospirillum sp. XM-1]
MTCTEETRAILLAFAGILGSTESSRDRFRMIALGSDIASKAGMDSKDFEAAADMAKRAEYALNDHHPRTTAEYIIESLEDGSMRPEDMKEFIAGEAQDIGKHYADGIMKELAAIGQEAERALAILESMGH